MIFLHRLLHDIDRQDIKFSHRGNTMRSLRETCLCSKENLFYITWRTIESISRQTNSLTSLKSSIYLEKMTHIRYTENIHCAQFEGIYRIEAGTTKGLDFGGIPIFDF